MSTEAGRVLLTSAATVGYTTGVFDLFHVGHLNLLRAARERCDLLIVGVTTDELAEQMKGEPPVIPLVERMMIVQSLRYVDQVVPQERPHKVDAWNSLLFDVLFVGDNLRDEPRWRGVEKDMAEVGVDVVYLPATHAESGELLDRGIDDVVVDDPTLEGVRLEDAAIDPLAVER